MWLMLREARPQADITHTSLLVSSASTSNVNRNASAISSIGHVAAGPDSNRGHSSASSTDPAPNVGPYPGRGSSFASLPILCWSY